MASVAACTPADTVAPPPSATIAMTATATFTVTPMPPTWTPTHTSTPLPPTLTRTPSLTPTPLDPEAACAAFEVLRAPDADRVLYDDDVIFFMWSDQPPDTQVGLAITHPDAEDALHVAVYNYRDNGIVLPAHTLPIWGTLDWELSLVYHDAVICRHTGQMQKAASATSTPTTTPPTPVLTASPDVSATATAAATPAE